MAIITKNISLEDAIEKSHYMLKNTFIWTTKENLFSSELSKEYDFNSIGVLWGKHNYAYTCYISVDSIDESSKNSTLIIGANNDNGYFASLEELRSAHPKLFEVTGEFRALVTLR